MNFLEKDLEQIIFETENEKLLDRGLEIHGKKIRQLRIGNYGVSDIVIYHIDRSNPKNPTVYITICEIKLNEITESTFFQALRYVKGIRSYIQKKYPHAFLEFSIFLIGKKLDDKSSVWYLTELSFDVRLFTYSYGIDGIVFKEHSNLVLTNEGF